MVWSSKCSYQSIFRAFHHVSQLQMSGMGGEANIAVFVETSQRVNAWLAHMGAGVIECGGMLGSNCKV